MAKHTGSDPDRESIGLTGHCDACAENGHLNTHPDLGCSDVGCNLTHEPAVSDPQQATENRDALDAADARLAALDAASEYLNVRRTAAALAVIGHAAAQAGAVRVSFEFTAIDRGYSLYNAAGEDIDFDSFPAETEAAVNLGLDSVDDRRPSLLLPYALDLDVDKNTGEVNSVTAAVTTLIEGPTESARIAPEVGEAQTAALALSDLAYWARYEAAGVSRPS